MANRPGGVVDTHIQPNGEESYHLTREGGLVTVVFFMPPTPPVEK